MSRVDAAPANADPLTGPIERAGRMLLAVLAPVTFLVLDPAGWFPFGPAKWMAVSVLGFAGAGLVLCERSVRAPATLVWAVTAFVGSMAVAASLGLDPLYAWIGTPERHLGLLTWVLCAALMAAGSALGTADRASAPAGASPGGGAGAVLVGLVAAGLAVGGFAVAEVLGFEPHLFDAGSRLTGTFGSAAYLGAASGLLLPVLAVLALGRPGAARRPGVVVRGLVGSVGPPGAPDVVGGEDRRRPLVAGEGRLRRGAALGAVLVAVAAVGSGARAAWLGLVAAVVVTAWSRRRAVRLSRRGLVVGAVTVARRALVGGGVVLALSVIGLVVLTPVGDRLGALGDPDAPGGAARLDEWRVALSVIGDHPVTGTGPEGYRIAFPAAVDADYERAHDRTRHPDRAHSAPLDVAAAGGLPALVAWLAVLAGLAPIVGRALRHGPVWRTALAAGLVSHVFGQLALFPLAELEPVAWLLAGLLVGSDPARPVRRAGSRGRSGTMPSASQALAPPVGAPVPWACPAVAPGRHAPGRVEPAGAELDVASAAAVDRAGSEPRAAAPGRALTVPSAPRAVSLRWAAPILLLVAGIAVPVGITDLVADRRADRAVVALERGDARGAARHAQGAVDLRPDVVRLHVLAAAALVADDQGALSGIHELERALDVSPGDPIVLGRRLGLLVDRAEATQVPAHIADARRELDDRLAVDPDNAGTWAEAERVAVLEGDGAAVRRARQEQVRLAPRSRAER